MMLPHTDTVPVNCISGWLHFRIFFIVGFLLLLFSGCAFLQNLPEAHNRRQPPYDADLATLQHGDTAFREGNYQKAIEIYSILSQIAKNKTTRRKALYGLACTKLVLAETPAERNEAIILWDAWSELAPSEMPAEDPRMLRPVLTGKNIPDSPPPKEIFPSESPNQEAMREQEIQSRDKKIKKLKKSISAQQKEIEKLKHQINSLEAIDKDMMQKKKEISTQ